MKYKFDYDNALVKYKAIKYTGICVNIYKTLKLKVQKKILP